MYIASLQCVYSTEVAGEIINTHQMYVAPGLCWADRGGWGEGDAGGVAVCRVRQYLKSCHILANYS